MAYDAERSYTWGTLAAQNVVMTASGAIAPGTAVTIAPVAEATFLCSVAGAVTATPSSFPAGVKPYVIVGTSTTTGATAIVQASGSGAVSTFVPSIALAAGTPFSIGLVATGTASATQTLGATSFIAGLAPQYV